MASNTRESRAFSCRSCTSFAAWAAQAKQKTAGQDGSGSGVVTASSLTAAAAAAASDASTIPRPDCPPDVEALGRSSWTLLHSIAASYPEAPSRAQQSDLLGFVGLFSRLYPCWVCADDFQAYMTRRAPPVAGRREFGDWLCAAHNDVNRRLGKPEFDCAKWEERWRTGWKDGRCD